MFTDLSLPHIFILLVVAIVVVGPKDLPQLLRKVGKFMGKMRGMANEFRASFDEMARQSELDDLRKEVEAMRKASQAALPTDLGIASSLHSDAEAAYLANWEASHAPSADSLAPEPSILPPPALAPPAETPALAEPAKPKRAAKTASENPAKIDPVAEAAPKPRARKAKPGADA